MPISLNSFKEEELISLEKGDFEPVLYKGSDIEFIYNKLNLGEGKLYILEKRLLWINENANKRNVTNFKELCTNNIYLNHYEKNRNFYLHLLNEVNNISIDSSNIALHAITSDKKICDNSCVYIQLNTDISDHLENWKNDEPVQRIIKSEQTNDDEENSDTDNDLPYDEISTPEILLVSKNSTDNDLIFRNMSNMDNSNNEDEEMDEEEDEQEEEEEEVEGDVVEDEENEDEENK
ncbi:hypothetical protein PFFCH_01407 [Plasmodium falciparum FCH/4]|uniref:Voldacs domain-containing protein n=1 Tax=Plasmodium falciparum FCH/4 TaxID=1036724 RepID=A0A024VQY4_PLAFA|nr:hypothetical protein PFFCH_01407 [Plasmodium falciparum FCH/4]